MLKPIGLNKEGLAVFRQSSKTIEPTDKTIHRLTILADLLSRYREAQRDLHANDLTFISTSGAPRADAASNFVLKVVPRIPSLFPEFRFLNESKTKPTRWRKSWLVEIEATKPTLAAEQQGWAKSLSEKDGQSDIIALNLLQLDAILGDQSRHADRLVWTRSKKPVFQIFCGQSNFCFLVTERTRKEIYSVLELHASSEKDDVTFIKASGSLSAISQSYLGRNSFTYPRQRPRRGIYRTCLLSAVAIGRHVFDSQTDS